MQCDFDTIGTPASPPTSKPRWSSTTCCAALGFERFTIHVNNRARARRACWNRSAWPSSRAAVLRALDKLAKIGADARGRGNSRSRRRQRRRQASNCVALLDARGHERRRCSQQLRPLVAGSETRPSGRRRGLREILAATVAALPACGPRSHPARRRRSPAASTTTPALVLETSLDDLPDIGSVCSGGRYDNLAELYTKQELPGIGASLGLDRLLAAMEELGMIEPVRTPAAVFIPFFDATRLGDYFRLAAALRAAGLGVEVYPEPKKLGQQLQYADRRGFRVALIAGERRVRRRRVPGEGSRQRREHDRLARRRRRGRNRRNSPHLGEVNEDSVQISC